MPVCARRSGSRNVTLQAADHAVDDGTLVADDKEQEDFQACQRRFRAAFDLGNALFDTSG